MRSADIRPLIVTLRFDDASFERFDAMRRRHFPPDRNHIPAHLTLFHALPGEAIEEVRASLAEACAGTALMRLRVPRLRFLGYGSAYAVDCPALTALRKDLAARFSGLLGRQDASGFSPHVTIQNKAPAGEAKTLFAALQVGFAPFEATGTGLLLWRYLGGPWERVDAFDFDGGPPVA